MDTHTPNAAFLELVRARADASGLRPESEAKLREVGLAKMGELLGQCRTREQGSRVGLVWAVRLAERAARSGDSNDLDQALFRFAHHLRRAAGSPTSDGERVLAHAAELAFRSLRRPPRQPSAVVDEGVDIEFDDNVWTSVLGVGRRRYADTLTDVKAFLHGPRQVPGRPDNAGPQTAEPPNVDFAPFGPSNLPAPSWLTLPSARESAPLVVQVRSWNTADSAWAIDGPDLRSEVPRTWDAFVAGDLASTDAVSRVCATQRE
jgi:hypothetical protein